MEWTLCIVFASWFVATLLDPIIGYHAVGIVFLIPVVISSLLLSRRWVLFMAVLLSLVHNFFFIPPRFHLTIKEPQDLLIYLMFFLTAFLVGHLTTKLKLQNKLIEEREKRTESLFQLAHAVSEANEVTHVVEIGISYVKKMFSGEVGVVFFNPEQIASVHEKSTYAPKGRELTICEWVRVNTRYAGRFTENFPEAIGTYFPIACRKTVIGVLGLKLSRREKMGKDRLLFCEALVAQLASGLEREIWHESRKRMEVLEQADRLFRTLFDSVSHELKTPLTTIRGAASLLSQGGEKNTMDLVKDLSGQVEDQVDRVLKVVDNMLDITRLESGNLKPSIDTYVIADILGPALKEIEPLTMNRRIRTEISPEIRAFKCDAPLTVQSLRNILRNSLTYTEDNSEIEISAHNNSDGAVEIKIKDNGPGLPSGDPNIVMKKFFRGNPEKKGGLGLGLSIAKGFIELQGGKLMADNRKTGGAVFTIVLPAG